MKSSNSFDKISNRDQPLSKRISFGHRRRRKSALSDSFVNRVKGDSNLSLIRNKDIFFLLPTSRTENESNNKIIIFKNKMKSLSTLYELAIIIKLISLIIVSMSSIESVHSYMCQQHHTNQHHNHNEAILDERLASVSSLNRIRTNNNINELPFNKTSNHQATITTRTTTTTNIDDGLDASASDTQIYSECALILQRTYVKDIDDPK